MIRRSMTEPCQMCPLAVPVCALDTTGSFAIGALTRVVTLNYHPVDSDAPAVCTATRYNTIMVLRSSLRRD